MLRIKIRKVNKLSTRLDWKVGVEKDNENQTLIKIAKDRNKEVVRVVKKIKKIRIKILRGDEYQVKGDLVLKK